MWSSWFKDLQAETKTQIHYPIPVHLQKAYLDLGVKVRLPVTEKISNEILSLPMFPYLTDTEVEMVAKVVKDASNS